MSTFIRDWEELKKINNESETHILEVNDCNAWLICKNKEEYDPHKPYFSQIPHLHVYLSTHTFYGENYEFSTKVLQACGFDVELANWDTMEDYK